jgi:hypothetical protein
MVVPRSFASVLDCGAFGGEALVQPPSLLDRLGYRNGRSGFAETLPDRRNSIGDLFRKAASGVGRSSSAWPDLKNSLSIVVSLSARRTMRPSSVLRLNVLTKLQTQSGRSLARSQPFRIKRDGL